MNVPLDIAPGLQTDDTRFAKRGWWSDADKARFWRGLPQTIGGWESFIGDMLTGVCRNVFSWADNTPVINTAFGTHRGLQVEYGGALFDITPVLVAATGSITSTGAAIANETFTIGTQVFTFKAARAAPYEVTISATPATQATNIAFAINTDIPTVVTAVAVLGVVNLTAVTTGPAGNIALSEAATNVTVSGATLTGGRGFIAGNIDGTGGFGYSVGTWSTGLYSTPGNEDYFPLTWSMSAYGESLIANPRGQTIFQWSNNTGAPAIPLSGAPAVVTYALSVQTRQVMAFGCNEEASGVFNPLCIRFSDVEDPTDWTSLATNLAGEVVLEGGGRIVAAAQIGEYLNVWTDTALFIGRFTGSVFQPWKFDKLGDGCGLIGPNAAAIMGQRAFWCAPNKQFYTCPMGGEPQMIVSPVQVEFSDNLTDAQYDKIVASTVSEFNEIWWFYPDARDGPDGAIGVENSRYFSLTTDNLWSKGTLARTAYADAGPLVSPVGVTYEGQVYYHERGTSADGEPIVWYVESADQYIAEAESLVMLRGVWPDFQNQQSALEMTVKTRLYPQGAQRTKGPYVLGPGKKRKDILVQSRIVQVKISGSLSPSFARLGKIEMDVAQTGKQ